MERLPALRIRMADLVRLRDEYEAADKRHLVNYITLLIADASAEIAALEVQAEPIITRQAQAFGWSRASPISSQS